MRFKVSHKLNPLAESSLLSRLKSKFNVDSAIIKNGFLVLPSVEDTAHNRTLIKEIYGICSKLQYECIFEQTAPTKMHPHALDQLIERGDIVPLGDQLCSFQGDFLKVCKSINVSIQDWGAGLGAVEQDHPVIWPIELLHRINYLRDFPDLAYFAFGVSVDPMSVKNLKTIIDDEGAITASKNVLEKSRFALQNAVCDCCYYGLQNQNLTQTSYFTTYNKVVRNERQGLDLLTRLRCFSVRDIMVVGDESQCEAALALLREKIISFIEALCITCKIETANDPFFGEEAILKSVFQSSLHSKYEILAAVEPEGPPVAIGSINRHQTSFTKAFDIRINGEPAVSACIGIGLERLAMSLFSHFGADVKHWPSHVTETLRL